MTAPYKTSFPLPEWLHQSAAKQIAKSPAHYAQYLLETERKDTPAMLFGRAVHAHLFDLHEETIAVWNGDRRGKDWTAFKEEFDATRDILTLDENLRAHACADAIRNDPTAGPLLKGVLVEKEYEWTLNGRKCAGRIDVLGPTWLADVKTTTCSDPGWFMRHALKMGYLEQAAFYVDGMLSLDHPIQNAYLIVAETKPPFSPVVYDLNGGPLEYGRKRVRLWLERLAQCEASGTWPSYAQSLIPFEVPAELDMSGMDEEDE